MRVGSHPEAGRPGGVGQGAAPAPPRREFSGVLKDSKDQPNSALREDLNPDSTGTGKAPVPNRAPIPCGDREKTSVGPGGDGQAQPSAAEAEQMKVESHPESSRPAGVGQGAAPSLQRAKYSEVPKDRKDRRDSAGGEDLNGDPTLLNDAAPPLAAVTPSMPDHVDRVDSGKASAPISEALVVSLVREITVQIQPGGTKSLDIQFDSRTLQGLHVRIQNAGAGLNVQFSASSEAISRLLTTNAHALTDALQQRGYVAPVITVQRPQGSAAYSGGDSRQSGRDRSGRNGNEHGGGGQKRR